MVGLGLGDLVSRPYAGEYRACYGGLVGDTCWTLKSTEHPSNVRRIALNGFKRTLRSSGLEKLHVGLYTSIKSA